MGLNDTDPLELAKCCLEGPMFLVTAFKIVGKKPDGSSS